ncbi:MAG: hypothetical protein ACFFA3_19360 [Promethearchaeota archaeon]
MDIIKTEKSIIDEDRFRENRIVKVKRLKTGMIIAIIAGSLFIASQSLILVNQNWYSAARQRLSVKYERGIIDYSTYDLRSEELEANLYTNLFNISILSSIASISASIIFIFIIISLLSIVIDESFNRKTRRLALGLAVISLFFVLYPMFFGTNTFYYLM